MEPKHKTIMYVDDDADDRELLMELLLQAEPGVNVVLATNGVEALRYLDSASATGAALPCLIILDMNMPYLDGSQTFERIRADKRFSGITVVMYSSSEKPDDRVHFNSRGVEFITKPDDYTFMSRVAGHLVTRCA
ncbi:response regulator [Flaviaesturariibacter amylovorans]|uniref:Response regulator n=1 Tax=Flaviaesturariibacter amylovorans TaxID=1084520 RepID=A0ABP8HSR3_9BACT